MIHFFLAGAHTHGTPLPELVDEIRAIERALEPMRQRGLCQVQSNRAANVDDIFAVFSSGQAVEVFHYAGHAEGEILLLEEAGHSKGIAELFGLRQGPKGPLSLRLVFLNGCATRAQVADLHRAGVAAVIATRRPIGDRAARLLAETFYRTWMLEGKTLTEAFQTATARVHTLPEASERGFQRQPPDETGGEDDIPWGLYFHPDLPEAGIGDWIVNQRPQLPAMLLAEVRPNATQRLRELVQEFRRSDPEVNDLIRRERKDPLLVLIERMPWIVGTHLRRLFAVEADQTMTQPGRERLRELIAAYTELNRLLSYLSLSLLWDTWRTRRTLHPGEALPELPFDLIPEEEDAAAVDFVYRTSHYHDRLQQWPDEVADPLDLLPAIGNYLAEVHRADGLRNGYLFMEELQQALAAGKERFETLLRTRVGDQPDGERQLVLEAEAVYARFLQAGLFLTRYRLHTVRSIVVDKLRNLAARQRPYSHYTISLHAAFSKPQALLTERETATDNYCLLLTRRQEQGDVLADAVNLSPFYIDRSSYIGNNADNYPALFALDYRRAKGADQEYVFHYIDADINHTYAFANDHELVIDSYGAVLPDHVTAKPEEMERFERIYEQLRQLEEDVSGPSTRGG